MTVIALALGCILLSSANVNTADSTLYIQPLGDGVRDEEIAYVKRVLWAYFGNEVVVLKKEALPTSGYYAPNKRYRAEKLLEMLASEAPRLALRVLGVTACDISTTKGKYKDWGVVGLANYEGVSCVISSFRCKRGVDRSKATVRLAKAAVHEIGHTFSLPHCPDSSCIMQDAKGSVTTFDRADDICAACRKALEKEGHPVRKISREMWSEGFNEASSTHSENARK